MTSKCNSEEVGVRDLTLGRRNRLFFRAGSTNVALDFVVSRLGDDFLAQQILLGIKRSSVNDGLRVIGADARKGSDILLAGGIQVHYSTMSNCGFTLLPGGL